MPLSKVEIYGRDDNLQQEHPVVVSRPLLYQIMFCNLSF